MNKLSRRSWQSEAADSLMSTKEEEQTGDSTKTCRRRRRRRNRNRRRRGEGEKWWILLLWWKCFTCSHCNRFILLLVTACDVRRVRSSHCWKTGASAMLLTLFSVRLLKLYVSFSWTASLQQTLSLILSIIVWQKSLKALKHFSVTDWIWIPSFFIKRQAEHSQGFPRPVYKQRSEDLLLFSVFDSN